MTSYHFLLERHSVNGAFGELVLLAIKTNPFSIQQFESLKHPYESKCRDENLSELIPYSRLACLRMCEENFVIEKCKCKMPVDTVNTRE